MTPSLSTRATAFGLAALITLTMLASIEQLAASPVPAEALARAGKPLQVVVVTARKLPQS